MNNTGSAPDGTTTSGPMQLYEHRLGTGELRPDENQLVVVEHLQRLSNELDGYKHRQRSSDGMLSDMSTVCSNCHLYCFVFYFYESWHTLLEVLGITSFFGFLL